MRRKAERKKSAGRELPFSINQDSGRRDCFSLHACIQLSHSLILSNAIQLQTRTTPSTTKTHHSATSETPSPDHTLPPSPSASPRYPRRTRRAGSGPATSPPCTKRGGTGLAAWLAPSIFPRWRSGRRGRRRRRWRLPSLLGLSTLFCGKERGVRGGWLFGGGGLQFLLDWWLVRGDTYIGGLSAVFPLGFPLARDRLWTDWLGSVAG